MSQLVDLLDEDKPIAEQKFVCLSFVSPEKEIKRKEIFQLQLGHSKIENQIEYYRILRYQLVPLHYWGQYGKAHPFFAFPGRYVKSLCTYRPR